MGQFKGLVHYREFPMYLEYISFGCGVLLLLIGMMGGGFKFRRLHVAQVNPGIRMVSSVIGLLLVCLGFGVAADLPHKSPSGVRHAGAASGPVQFTLADHLQPKSGELSRQITVLVEGQNVGTLDVNLDHPDAKLTVRLARAGWHCFTTEGTTVLNVKGSAVQYPVPRSATTIDVSQDHVYDVRSEASRNPWQVSLAQAPFALSRR